MRSKAIAKSDTIDAAKLEKLKLESEFYSINTKLSFSKLFAYCYCYIGILTGPYFKYRTYNDWINFKYVNSIDHTRLMFKRGNTLPFIAIGYLAGYDLTGNVDGNVLLGGFGGNAGGLDISTASNTLTLSNGAGTVRLHYTANGNFVTKIHSSSTTLWANGFLEIFATSNTSLTFRYRGSDGSTRSASLTLS
jgi:hypothetical protein